MRWFTPKNMVAAAAFLLIATLWTYVYSKFGDAAGDRLWGAGLLLAATLWMRKKELPVTFGRHQRNVAGWRRMLVLVPFALFGLLVTLYPHEAACALHFRNRVCP